MNFPTSIEVYGQKYQIKLRKKLELEGEECHGYIDFDEKVIYLKRGKKKDMTQSLIHECMHAVFKESGVGYVLSEDVEEVIVRNIEKFLFHEFNFRL